MRVCGQLWEKRKLALHFSNVFEFFRENPHLFSGDIHGRDMRPRDATMDACPIPL